MTEEQQKTQDKVLKKLEKKIVKKTAQAIDKYNLIEDGDKVMVCMSGGKDSYTLLEILLLLQTKAPINFKIIAVHLNQNQPNYPADVLPKYFATKFIEHHIIDRDTYSVVQRIIPEGKTTCSLCSRMRRGILYDFAYDHKVTKIALGHHRDDIIETFFLNLFFNGKIKAMPPKLLSDDKRNVVIRPMAFVSEDDTREYAKLKNLPIIPCNLCGTQDNLQRVNIKNLLSNWQKTRTDIKNVIFTAMSNISPSQMLDDNLYNFVDLACELKEN